jgi:hypothetical protein
MTKESSVRKRYRDALEKSLLSGKSKLAAEMIAAILDNNVKKAAKLLRESESL